MSQDPYKEMIQNMPPGVDRAILRILNFHRGRGMVIGGEELNRQLNLTGFPIENRTMREAIKGLRREGHLICSMPGTDGGYYLAQTNAEYEEFKRQEFLAKIADMSETLQAMDRSAREQFGQGVQESLF